MKCSNNLKQLALACHGYHDANGRLPDGGDRHRHGLMWHVLPFVESAARDSGGHGWSRDAVTHYYCPSRRSVTRHGGYALADYCWLNEPVPWVPGCMHAMTSLGTGAVVPVVRWSPGQPACGPLDAAFPVSLAMVPCTSGTVLLTEKGLHPSRYTATSGSEGDGPDVYGRTSYTTARDPSLPPRHDGDQPVWLYSAGSAHPGGLNAAFCDGGVRLVSYTIDPAVWRQGGRR
jgi:prepilin-type processing-associated H-X9-DG protein